MAEYVGEGGLNDIRDRIFKRRGSVTLNSTGDATIVFDPPIIMDRAPYVELQPWIALGANPVVANPVVGTLTTNASGAYTGVSIKGARTQDLPTGLTSVNVSASLAGRKVTENATVNGVRVDWLAY